MPIDTQTKKMIDSLADAFKDAKHPDDHNTIDMAVENVAIVDEWLNADNNANAIKLGLDGLENLGKRIQFVLGVSVALAANGKR